jgi:hypothetical protein
VLCKISEVLFIVVYLFILLFRNLNNDLTRSKWTPKEDETLKEAVKLYGFCLYNYVFFIFFYSLKNWGQVANCLDGRTGQQCLHRYQKTLDPDIKKGKWDWEEDRILQLATAIYGVFFFVPLLFLFCFFFLLIF